MRERTGSRRVLFLSDHLGYAHGAVHGATSYFLNVLPALSARVDLTVCFLRESHPAAARLEERGLHPIFLGRRRSDPRALLDLVRLLRRESPDVLHAAGMKGILFGRIAARLAGLFGGRRPLSMIHLHDLHPPGRVLGAAQRALAPMTRVALAVSRAVADCAERDFAMPASRVRVIHNPLVVERYADPPPGARERIREELGIEAAQPVIGVIGRLSAEKGHEHLLRALPSVLEAVPDTVLVVAGDGVLRRECERLAGRLGATGAVRFVGHRSDVPEILAAVDVVAVPSVHEGFSYAALEAMAARRPVVAFAVGGLQEIVRHERNGLLVPAGDSEALAAGIVRVLRDEALRDRLVTGGIERVRHHSVEAHVSELVALYDEVTGSLLAMSGPGERTDGPS